MCFPWRCKFVWWLWSGLIRVLESTTIVASSLHCSCLLSPVAMVLTWRWLQSAHLKSTWIGFSGPLTASMPTPIFRRYFPRVYFSVVYCAVVLHCYMQFLCVIQLKWVVQLLAFTMRHGYASAVLGVVILSVCLSVTRYALLCDKTIQCTAVIFIPHERAITLVFWHQQYWVGDAPSVWNLRSKWPTPFKKCWLWQISAYSASTIRHSGKSSIVMNR